MAMVWKSKTRRINKVLLAGETILVGQALCIKDTESTVKLADSDAVGGALMPCIGFAGNGASIGGPVEVVTEGLLSGVDTPAEGRSVFVSATAGAVDQTGGTYQQVVGTALTSTLMEVSV